MQEEIKFREVYFHMAEGQLEICVNNDSLHSRKRAADRVVYDVEMGMNSILRQLSVVPFDIGIEALKLKTETAILLLQLIFLKPEGRIAKSNEIVQKMKAFEDRFLPKEE